MSSYTTTDTLSGTFTIVHARYIASKVATDLLRFQRLYGSPDDKWINWYEEELTVLLQYDIVDKVVYGFKRNNFWTMASVQYVALPGGSIQTDDDPGKIRAGVDVSNAFFSSSLTHNSRWLALSPAERANIESKLPFQRSAGNPSALERGSWTGDRNYYSNGRGLSRSTVRD